MIAELGKFLALLAFVLAVGQALFGFLAREGRPPLAEAAAACAQAAFIASAAAFVLLVSLFLRSDFSVAVVADNSHTLKPLIYKIAGTWGNHEGSMLLWCVVATGFAALFASFPGRLSPSLWSKTCAVLGLCSAAALAYTLFLSSPFARLDPAPLQGRDLNPLLQDPALAAHPPMLYLGYVGMSVPFALAIAALLEGKIDQAWARALRPWALSAWTFLTIGIALGSYWAYYELGWGGWWFWDPVENASFMPWLAAAALIHSAIVTEKRGGLAAWTILLAILSFGLVLLGAFLVRSGVLTSVHAFAIDPARGAAVFSGFLAAMICGLGLFAWRAQAIAKPAAFALASRESALILNNYGLAIATGIVLAGTIYPLVIDALTGELISVGPPFFDIAFSPLMALLLLALPFGPMLAWRRGDLAKAWRGLWLAAALSAAAGLIMMIAAPRALFAALGVAVGMWLILGGLAYLWKRAGEGDGRLRRAMVLPLAVWSMSLAHFGVGVLTIGAVAETNFRHERSVALRPGEAVDFAGRTIRLERLAAVDGPNFYADEARFSVSSGETLVAQRRFYPAAGQPTSEVGIAPSWTGDLYIALGEPQRDTGAIVVRLYKKPMVQLVFLGATIMAAGGALALGALLRRRTPAPDQAAAPVQTAAAEST